MVVLLVNFILPSRLFTSCIFTFSHLPHFTLSALGFVLAHPMSSFVARLHNFEPPPVTPVTVVNIIKATEKEESEVQVLQIPNATAQCSVRPTQALVVMEPWVKKIFGQNKMWELRSNNTKKRGVFGIAISKTSIIQGQVSIVDSIPVGKRGNGGEWEPFSNSKQDVQNFLFNPENIPKHQAAASDIPKTYKYVYAWILTNVIEYNPPLQYSPTPGPLWAPLEGKIIWPEHFVKKRRRLRGKQRLRLPSDGNMEESMLARKSVF